MVTVSVGAMVLEQKLNSGFFLYFCQCAFFYESSADRGDTWCHLLVISAQAVTSRELSFGLLVILWRMDEVTTSELRLVINTFPPPNILLGTASLF